MSTALTASNVNNWLKTLAPEIERALPSMIDSDQFIRVVLTTMRRNPKLLQCSEASIAASLMTSAQLGLKMDGVLGHAYPIPYGRECTLVIGYKGYLELARRSDEILDITPACVYKGDDFHYTLGDSPSIHHVPGDEYGVNDDEITHVYVVVNLKGGGKVMEVWPRKRVDAHRDKYSKGASKSDSPWRTAYARMAKKTVIRSMVCGGLVPLSVEAMRAASNEEVNEARTVQGSVVSSKRTLDSLADGVLDEVEDAQVMDDGELLAKATDELKETTSVANAVEVYESYQGRLSAEAFKELGFILETHKEFLG